MKIHKLTLAALLVAIGTLSAHLIYIPAAFPNAFPCSMPSTCWER